MFFGEELARGALAGLVVAALTLQGARGGMSAGTLVAGLYALRQFESLREEFRLQLEALAYFLAEFRYVVEFLDCGLRICRNGRTGVGSVRYYVARMEYRPGGSGSIRNPQYAIRNRL
jgi:hypothetical protein